MRSLFVCRRLCLIVTALGAWTVAASAADPQPRLPAAPERAFTFHYDAAVTELPRGERVRVWLPLPPSNEHQTVQVLDRKLPVEAKTGKDPEYGNAMLYFELSAPAEGRIDIQTSYRVRRQEVRGLEKPDNVDKLPPRQRRRLTSADAKVPIDGKPLELLTGKQLPGEPIRLGRALYDLVDDHVQYDKSKPGYGQGDSVWVCDSRTGNCTDFHSLFISLARSRGLPARFEIGFPLPAERGQGTLSGYHCWAFLYVDDHGWVPVDISEADKHPELKDYYYGNLTADRIAFTQGRDLTLAPKQAGPPLNYFIYPYVEVAGKAWPQERIEPKFSYADLP